MAETTFVNLITPNDLFDMMLEPAGASVMKEPAPTVEEVVTKLQSLGAFLGGSREKLQDFDYSTDRDWDFNVQYEDKGDLIDYIDYNFTSGYSDDGYSDGTFKNDPQFIGYRKHIHHPHITVILRKDLELYKKMWKAIPKWYWENYMWKSAPHVKEAFSILSDHTRKMALKSHKKVISDQFKMLDEFMNNIKAPTKKDCM